MRRIKALFITFSVCVLFACSSVDSDAKKAADLMDKSMEATLEYDFEEAEKYYKLYKEIEDKYKDHPEQREFEEAYWQYKLKKES